MTDKGLTYRRSRGAALILAVTCLLALVGSATGCSDQALKDPALVVEAYLEALAAGDAARALSYDYWLAAGYDRRRNTPELLTDAVLVSALANDPLTVQSVTEVSRSGNYPGIVTASVRAEYMIGERRLPQMFYLQQASRGSTRNWYLLRAWNEVNFEYANSIFIDTGKGEAIPLLLNDVPVTGTSFDLFPGVYQFSTPNSFVTLTGGQFTVDGQGHCGDLYCPYRTTILDASLALTDEAQRAIGAQAQAQIDQCLEERSVETACNFRQYPWIREPDKIDPQTVSWSLETWNATTPPLDLSTWGWGLVMGAAHLDNPKGLENYYLTLTAKRWDGSDVSDITIFPTICAVFPEPDTFEIRFTDSFWFCG